MSIDIDDFDYESEEHFDDDVFSSRELNKKKAIEKRRNIREAIELRDMAKSLDLNDEDYRSMFYK